MNRCDCPDPEIGIQYVLTPCDYDGVSEWQCGGCRRRWGRWSGLELKDGELEARYGQGSPYRLQSEADVDERETGEKLVEGGSDVGE